MCNTKQVIVIRKDLKMRMGKACSQASHASMAALLNIEESKDPTRSHVEIPMRPDLRDWLNNSFTKVCVYVTSEQELLDVFSKAREKGLLCSLITDNGRTEFHGIPTVTCCAIGPGFIDDVNDITGHLPLL